MDFPNRKHNPALTPRARELRKNMTREESHLWYDYLSKYLIRFLRQKVIDCYIVDFYCRTANLVIELDGSQHYEEDAVKYDENRTSNIEKRGIMVIRIPNNEIHDNFDGVCAYIDRIVNERISEKDNE